MSRAGGVPAVASWSGVGVDGLVDGEGPGGGGGVGEARGVGYVPEELAEVMLLLQRVESCAWMRVVRARVRTRVEVVEMCILGVALVECWDPRRREEGRAG